MAKFGVMKKMSTWAKRTSFYYYGSVKRGTLIHFGKDYKYFLEITEEEYSKLLKHFHGLTVGIGTSKDNPAKGTLGEWVKDNIARNALPSYIGPILIKEKYAKKKGKTEIRFT